MPGSELPPLDSPIEKALLELYPQDQFYPWPADGDTPAAQAPFRVYETQRGPSSWHFVASGRRLSNDVVLTYRLLNATAEGPVIWPTNVLGQVLDYFDRSESQLEPWDTVSVGINHALDNLFFVPDPLLLGTAETDVVFLQGVPVSPAEAEAIRSNDPREYASRFAGRFSHFVADLDRPFASSPEAAVDDPPDSPGLVEYGPPLAVDSSLGSDVSATLHLLPRHAESIARLLRNGTAVKRLGRLESSTLTIRLVAVDTGFEPFIAFARGADVPDLTLGVPLNYVGTVATWLTSDDQPPIAWWPELSVVIGGARSRNPFLQA